MRVILSKLILILKRQVSVTVTLESGSTWNLTGDCYIDEFNGDASGIVSNGYTVYVNGNALAGTK